MVAASDLPTGPFAEVMKGQCLTGRGWDIVASLQRKYIWDNVIEAVGIFSLSHPSSVYQ